MSRNETIADEMKEAGRFFTHSVVVVLGLILLVIAAAMGVTLVLLPVGLLTGAAGLLLIVWGLYIKPRSPQDTGQNRAPPPS